MKYKEKIKVIFNICMACKHFGYRVLRCCMVFVRSFFLLAGKPLPNDRQSQLPRNLHAKWNESSSGLWRRTLLIMYAMVAGSIVSAVGGYLRGRRTTLNAD